MREEGLNFEIHRVGLGVCVCVSRHSPLRLDSLLSVSICSRRFYTGASVARTNGRFNSRRW